MRALGILVFLFLLSPLPLSAEEDTASLPDASKTYQGESISIDVQDAPIQSVLTSIAKISKLNIVLHPTVQGRVTLRINNVPWDQVLETLLRLKGLHKTREGNIILIFPVEHTDLVLRSG